MSRYRISEADKVYAAEFKRNLDAGNWFHSPGLQRVLNAMRGGPWAGKYVLVVDEPFKRWRLGKMPGKRGDPIEIVPGHRFRQPQGGRVGGVQAALAATHRRDPVALRCRTTAGDASVRILAYADRLSARPGEAVEIKVSCDGLARYEAELVRIIQGDINPDGPGYREDAVDVDFGGPFEGCFQPIHTGSYGIVEDNAAFRDLSTFTAFAAIWPTMPGEGPQTILARRDPLTGAGFELFLNDAGALEFSIAAGASDASSVSTEEPLLAQRWYLVAARLSTEDGRMTVTQHRLAPHLPAGRGGNRDPRRAGLGRSVRCSRHRSPWPRARRRIARRNATSTAGWSGLPYTHRHSRSTA